MDELWGLIQDEAQAVSGYIKFLDSDFAKSAEGIPFASLIRDMIIPDERDHLEALKFLYESFTKTKAAVDALELAKKLLAGWKDAKRIVK